MNHPFAAQVRDSDSRLNAREKAAVDEWLASGASIHVMRDHPNHKRPINAGMFGGRRDALRGKSMAGLVRAWRDKKAYGGDLRFLNRVVWPLVKRDQLGHDAYFCTEFLNSKSFPTKRPANFQHVGQLCGFQPLVWGVPTKLRNSLARSNQSRFG